MQALNALAGDNRNMQTLRNAPVLARLVLVWCALFLGVATAAPLLQPGQLQMICSGGSGMKLVDTGQPDGQPHLSAGMDCPLCASVLPPPAPAGAALSVDPVPAQLLVLRLAARTAVAAAPPLPSRGPPAWA